MRFALALRSPQNTLYAIAASSALCAISLLALDVRACTLSPDQTLPLAWKLPLFVLSASGLVLRILFVRGLRQGMNAGIWSESNLSEALQIAESSAWTAALWAFVFVGVILFVFTAPERILGTFGILPILSAQDARSILRPPIPRSRAFGANSIYPVKPLQSSQWGTKRVSWQSE